MLYSRRRVVGVRRDDFKHVATRLSILSYHFHWGWATGRLRAVGGNRLISPASDAFRVGCEAFFHKSEYTYESLRRVQFVRSARI